MRQSGGRGQYGHVMAQSSRCTDARRRSIYEFVNEVVGGVVPREYIPAVNKGIQEQMKNGVLAGYPLINVKATLFDGSFHEVDSSEMAFKSRRFDGAQGGRAEGEAGDCSSRS